MCYPVQNSLENEVQRWGKGSVVRGGERGRGRGGLGEGCGEVIPEVGKGRVLWGREKCSLSKVTHLPLFINVFPREFYV